MKIVKIFEKTEILIVELEVNLKKKQLQKRYQRENKIEFTECHQKSN